MLLIRRRLNKIKFTTEDNVEKTSLYLQKVGVILPGTMSHVIINDPRIAHSAKVRGEDVN